MARIYPFRAWRYNPSAVSLQDVVTQPYDKISPAMQQAYYQRSPYNLVRIILGLPELFDAERGESVYTRAARDLKAWREQGILTQEKAPCVYAYAQRFKVPGTEIVKERRGFIALGKLHEYAEQVVFRHEQTLSKPKGDRLNLLKATHAHFGQIFMLYSDPPAASRRCSTRATAPPKPRSPTNTAFCTASGASATPPLFACSRPPWPTKSSSSPMAIIATRPHSTTQRSTLLSRSTSEYGATSLPQPPYPEAAVMMTFVNMDSDGLVILPTHRVVHSLPGFDPAAFLRAAEQYFTVEALPEADATNYIDTLKAQQGTAFVAVTRTGAFLLRSKPEPIAAALANLPERQRRLDLSHLHSIVLDRLLGLDEEKVREQTNIRYLRDAAEAVDQVRRREADIAFLTNPVTMEQLKEVAFAGDVMPQKSTDFFPKLLSGLTIYALD